MPGKKDISKWRCPKFLKWFLSSSNLSGLHRHWDLSSINSLGWSFRWSFTLARTHNSLPRNSATRIARVKMSGLAAWKRAFAGKGGSRNTDRVSSLGTCIPISFQWKVQSRNSVPRRSLWYRIHSQIEHSVLRDCTIARCTYNCGLVSWLWGPCPLPTCRNSVGTRTVPRDSSRGTSCTHAITCIPYARRTLNRKFTKERIVQLRAKAVPLL